MPNLNLLALIVPEISKFIRTDGLGQIDSVIDPDQEYILFICTETLSSACYILFNDSNIPFYSRVTSITMNTEHVFFFYSCGSYRKED